MGDLDIRELVDIVAQAEYNSAVVDAVRSIVENVYISDSDARYALKGIVGAKGGKVDVG